MRIFFTFIFAWVLKIFKLLQASSAVMLEMTREKIEFYWQKFHSCWYNSTKRDCQRDLSSAFESHFKFITFPHAHREIFWFFFQNLTGKLLIIILRFPRSRSYHQNLINIRLHRSINSEIRKWHLSMMKFLITF